MEEKQKLIIDLMKLNEVKKQKTDYETEKKLQKNNFFTLNIRIQCK